MFKKMRKKYNETNFNSKTYWKERYYSGGNSGAGSYDCKAKYKAKILNRIIEDNKISNVIEFGCGDGNNLQYYNIENYTGFDLSEVAIEMCIKKYSHDLQKSFICCDPVLFKSGGLKAEMTISFEVIFHLIENDVFNKYMTDLFNTSSEYVLICSSNDSRKFDEALHVKHRKFTDSVPSNFSLIEVVKTPQEKGLNGFFSDFYLFKKSDI